MCWVQQPCLELHVFAIEQREYQSEGIVPHLPRRSGVRPLLVGQGTLLRSVTSLSREPGFMLVACLARPPTFRRYRLAMLSYGSVGAHGRTVPKTPSALGADRATLWREYGGVP